MKRWIYAYQLVSGNPERLERTLLTQNRELLQLATAAPDTSPQADGSFMVELSSHVAGLDLGKHVRVSTGVARRAGRRVILPLTWHAEPARAAFPKMEGSLELESLSRDTVQLTLVGSYRVPFGPVGALVDTTFLRDVGQHTAEHLIASLARELGRITMTTGAHPPAGPRRGAPLEVRDVMTSDPVVLDPDMPLRTAALLLFYLEISGAPVVADDGALVGVLSERDLLTKEAEPPRGFGSREEDRRRDARTVGEACTRPARVTVPDARLSAAARSMLEHNVSRLLVIDEGRVAGIVSRHDVLAALVRTDEEIVAAVQTLCSDVKDLRVLVAWGEVGIAGSVRLHSTAVRMVEAIAAIDGVMAVDDRGLSWETDDIIPTMVPFA